MAEEGTFCVNADVKKKAGAKASVTSTAEAYTNEYIKQAEGRIMALVREDFRTNYTSLNAVAKDLLREAASNLAAIYAISYDLSGFTSRIEAEDMINVLNFHFKQALSILMDQKFVTYSSSSAPTTSASTTSLEISLTAGEAFVNGEVGYLKTADGKVWKADADAESTTKGLVVMATAAISANAVGVFKIRGRHSFTHGYGAGTEIYLSPTAGAVTNTKPSNTGQQIRILGYAIDANTILYDPDNTYIELV